jgi:outer membrane protein TolC
MKRDTVGVRAIVLGFLLLPTAVIGQRPQDAPTPALPDVLTLPWAVDGALAFHPVIGASRAGVESARSTAKGARSEWWPQVTVGGTYTRYQFPMLVRPLHELDASQIQFDTQPITGRVFADWLVFDGGERRARIRRSDAGSQGAEATLAASEMSVIEQTSGAYLAVLTLREILEAREAQVRSLEAEASRVDLLLDAGRAPQVEVLRAQAALSQSRADRATIVAVLQAAEDQLARVVGVEGSDITGRQLTSVRSRAEAAPPPGTTVEARPDSLHPILRASWSRVTEASAGHAEARATWIPDLKLSAGARQYAAPSLKLTNEWQIGVSLSYPVFTGFRRSSHIAAAEARLGVAREEYRLRELELAQELDEARAALQEADARVEALEQAVTQFAEVARIEALALEAGAGVQRDFLDAQAALFQSQAALAEASNGRILAQVREAAARGLLDRAWLIENLETER